MFACVNCLAYLVLFFCLQDTALHYFNQMLLFTVQGRDICCSQYSNTELIYQIIN